MASGESASECVDLGMNWDDKLRNSRAKNKSVAELDIIAKSRMNDGQCIMAIDRSNKFYRPIYRTDADTCCWPMWREFKVGYRYKFTILRYPDDTAEALTPYPHRNEDTLVEKEVELVEEEVERESGDRRSDLYDCLYKSAVSNIEDIFEEIQGRKYVDELTECSSFGILRCKERDLRVETNEYGKKRLIISLPDNVKYDLPLKAYEYDYPGNNNTEALVLLGLGRPYDKEGQYSPKRCYILVVGILKREQ